MKLNPRYSYRPRLSFGPIRLNTSNGRITSVSVVFGRLSWNSRTRRITYDTPGPGSVSFDEPRRTNRSENA